MDTRYYFIIGAHKTGTTSIANAFEQLGFRAYKGITQYEMLNARQICHFLKLYQPAECQYQVFKDSPFNHFDHYKHLDKYFPNARFILTIRDSEEWYNSLYRWYKIHYTRPFEHVYQCNILDKNNKDHIISLYEQRNNDIIDYFKQNNKLIILYMNKDKLSWSKFLDSCFDEFIEKEFPQSNQNPKKKLVLSKH